MVLVHVRVHEYMSGKKLKGLSKNAGNELSYMYVVDLIALAPGAPFSVSTRLRGGLD